MKITILTLFPEMFESFLGNSIIKRAIAKGVVEIEAKNIRDYTLDKYHRTDTPPIGGGAGLIEKCQPIVDAIKAVKTPSSHDDAGEMQVLVKGIGDVDGILARHRIDQ